MATWLGAHALALLCLWYLLSAVVSGMPAPDAGASFGYRWAYRSLHVLAGDLSQYLQPKPSPHAETGGDHFPTGNQGDNNHGMDV